MTHTPSTQSGLIGRVLATVGALAVISLVVGAGVSAASANISTDRAPASISAVGALDASGITPGGQVERVVTIRVPAGTRPVLSVTAVTSSALDQDARNGLQLRAEACSQTWRRTASGYSCSGTLTTVMATRPIVGSTPLALPAQGDEGAQVRLTLSLPSSAGAEFMGQSSSLSYRIGR